MSGDAGMTSLHKSWVKKGRVGTLPLSNQSPGSPEKPLGRGTGRVRSIFRYDERTKTADLHASTHKGSADYSNLKQ